MLACRVTPRLLRITALLTLLSVPHATVAGEIQPDFPKFGPVRVGATVEGSVRTFREGEDASGLGLPIDDLPEDYCFWILKNISQHEDLNKAIRHRLLHPEDRLPQTRAELEKFVRELISRMCDEAGL